MKIQPLRDVVVVELCENGHATGTIQVVTARKPAVREAVVKAVGPECRDVEVGQVVIVNLLVATRVGEQYLVAEPQILGTR